MASSGAGNFYVIKQSGVSHSAVENILVGLQQLSSASGKKTSSKALATGKALLSQLRVVCFFLSVFRNSLSSGVRQGLLEVIRTCQDNSDTDRKIFRTILFILADDLEHTSLTITAGGKAVPVDAAEEAFLDYVAQEVSNTTNITFKSVVVTRLLGTISSMVQQRGLRDTRTAGLLRTYFNFLIDLSSQPTPQKKAMVLNAVGAAFSAMRRMGEVLPVESQTALLEALKSGSLTLQRHSLALVVNTIAQATDLETKLSWSQWFRGVLKDPATNASVLKDGLASSYAVRISTVLVLKCGENDRWPPEAIDLLIDTINVSTKAPLKFLTELVTFMTSPALSWRILPALENKQAGLVSLLCSALTAYVRNVSLEDIYLPVLLRACESMGRFLQQRPGFDSQHSHRVFSAHMVEKDGESLKALWIALRRLYRKAIAPKATAPAAPAVVRSILALQQRHDPSVSDLEPVSAAEYWAYDSDNLAQISQALPSPYIFSCLIRTLIWLAPDQRYCRKEHPILWHAFSEDLFSSWDILSTPASSLCSIGDPSIILQDLLAHLFSRVQSSMVVVELDRDHVDAAVAGDHATCYKCRLCCEPQYIHTLCTLTTATIRYALSPAVISLLPAIWSFIFGFASSTTNWKNALTLTNLWVEALHTVALLMDDFLASQQPYRRQLVLSVREEALTFLIHATELKAKLHLLLYRQHETNGDVAERDTDEDGGSSSSGASSWRASSMIDLFGAMTSSTHDGRSGGGGGGGSSSNPLLQAATLVAAAVPRERSVSLATVWEEIGWYRVYNFVKAQTEALSVFYLDECDECDAVDVSHAGMACGRFLLALCNVWSVFAEQAAGPSSLAWSINDEIADFLRRVQCDVLRDIAASYDFPPMAPTPVGDTAAAVATSVRILTRLLRRFPTYTAEHLLFREVLDHLQPSAAAGVASEARAVDLRRFATTFLMGIFGTPNMTFEDVTPVILSTLPSENVIETDFDAFDSVKGSSLSDARKSASLAKRPSLQGGGGGASTSSAAAAAAAAPVDDFDLFGSTTTAAAFDGSSKRSDSDVDDVIVDFSSAFGASHESSSSSLSTMVATATAASNSNSSGGSGGGGGAAAAKRPSSGKVSFAIPAPAAPLTPSKQSSNTTNAKLSLVAPPSSSAGGATKAPSGKAATTTTATATAVNVFGGDDVAVLTPAKASSASATAAETKPTAAAAAADAFHWDDSHAPAFGASVGRSGGGSGGHDDWATTPVAFDAPATASAAAAFEAFAPSFAAPSVAPAATAHDFDAFAAASTATATAPAVAAAVSKPPAKPTPVLAALSPPRDTAPSNRAKAAQGGAPKASKPSPDDVFGSHSAPHVLSPSTSTSTSSSVPTAASTGSSNTTDVHDATFFGAAFDADAMSTASASGTAVATAPAAAATTGGLLASSSAADLDFLGGLGASSRPPTATQSTKPSSSAPVASSAKQPPAPSSSNGSSLSSRLLMPLPPPAVESTKKPALSGAAAARRQSLGIGATAKATPPATNVAALFDGLVFDAAAVAAASTASTAAPATAASQPPPKPTFDDDWASSWDHRASGGSGSRRTSLNGPAPVDPFAPSTATLPPAAPAPSSAAATSDPFFAPSVHAHDPFAPSASAAAPAAAGAAHAAFAAVPNPFAPSTAAAPPAAAMAFAPSAAAAPFAPSAPPVAAAPFAPAPGYPYGAPAGYPPGVAPSGGGYSSMGAFLGAVGPQGPGAVPPPYGGYPPAAPPIAYPAHPGHPAAYPYGHGQLPHGQLPHGHPHARPLHPHGAPVAGYPPTTATAPYPPTDPSKPKNPFDDFR